MLLDKIKAFWYRVGLNKSWPYFAPLISLLLLIAISNFVSPIITVSILIALLIGSLWLMLKDMSFGTVILVILVAVIFSLILGID